MDIIQELLRTSKKELHFRTSKKELHFEVLGGNVTRSMSITTTTTSKPDPVNARRFCFTIQLVERDVDWDFSSPDHALWDADYIKRAVWQQEIAPSTGKAHIQGDDLKYEAINSFVKCQMGLANMGARLISYVRIRRNEQACQMEYFEKETWRFCSHRGL